MAKPFSEDLRERIVRAVEAGRSRHAVGRMFGVSASCVIKLMQRVRRTGSIAPGPRGKRAYALAGHEALVGALLAAQPDLTLDELKQELDSRGIRVGRSSINRFLLAHKLTFKKSHSTRPSRSGRTSPLLARTGALASRL